MKSPHVTFEAPVGQFTPGVWSWPLASAPACSPTSGIRPEETINAAMSRSLVLLSYDRRSRTSKAASTDNP